MLTRSFVCALLVAPLAARAVDVRLSPRGTEDMTGEIRAAVQRVRDAKKGGTITLAPGDYFLRSPIESDIWVSNHDNPRPRRIFLPVFGVTNLTVRCRGRARLVADGEGVCLALVDTKNVAFKGVAFDYARPFFSIWRLKDGKLAPEGGDYPYELQGRTIFATGRGWREKQAICEIFDGATRVFRGSTWWDGSLDRVFDGHPDGALAMTRSPYRPNPCVLLYRAECTAFIDCGAYAAAGMGLLAQRSGDIALDGWRTRDTRPLALQADATHFSNCRGLVKVVNSTFEGMVDDAINVHSTSLRIVERKGDRTLVCRYMHRQSVGFETFLAGETLRFIRGATLEPGAEAKVSSAKMLAHDRVEIVLAKPVPAPYGVGDAVENADWQPRVVFSGNAVRNSNPRATLFTTPGKIVCEDNLFENVAGQPIYFAGDAWDWYESGACRDVTIRNNVFRRCGFSSGRGMIQIEPAVHDLDAQKERYHRNILVEGNLFEDFTLPLVWARSAENVRLKDNRIVRGNDRTVLDRADVAR